MPRVPRRLRLPGGGAALRRRLAPLAARSCALGPRSSRMYCPSALGLGSFASGARGTRRKLVGCGAVLLAALVVGVGGAGGRSLATTTLLVEVSGSGSVGGGGQIGCGAGLVACYATYVSGSSVTISAAADSGWSFDSWSGCNTQSATTCTVNLDGGDHTVTVSFAPNVAPGDSTLTVSAPTDASGNGGNVTAGDEIDCGSDGTDDCTW